MFPEYDRMMERVGNTDLNKKGNVRVTLTHCCRRKAILHI